MQALLDIEQYRVLFFSLTFETLSTFLLVRPPMTMCFYLGKLVSDKRISDINFYCAAVLLGRTTSLARLSVRPSVRPVRAPKLPTRKQKGLEKKQQLS